MVCAFLVLKLAVTVRFALMATLQAPVPEQAPLQPAKTKPLAEVAVNVTWSPASNDIWQLVLMLQAIPLGWLYTVPLPSLLTTVVS